MAPTEPLLLEDVRLIFRNFAGKQGTYNNEGDRNFCVILPDEQAKAIEDDGWNVKWLKPRDEGDEPTPYIPVKVEYEKGRPPRVVLISSQGKVDLGATEVALVDAVEIKTADIILRPYNWVVKQGPVENKGTKAYLKTAYITIVEDDLELKYGAKDMQPADEDDD